MLARAYDRAVRRVALGILVLSALAAAPASASSVVISFRTPTGNIGCVDTSALAPGPNLRCDLDWGDSYELGATGRAGVTCHGDTAIDPRARVLRYGSMWRRGAFTCRSKTSGLRCRNLRGHGFFLS